MIRAEREVVDQAAARRDGEADPRATVGELVHPNQLGHDFHEIWKLERPAKPFATPAQAGHVAIGEDRLAIDGQDGFKQTQAVHQAAIRRRCRKIERIEPLTVAPKMVHVAGFWRIIRTCKSRMRAGLALGWRAWQSPAMRFQIFFSGVMMCLLGVLAMRVLEKNEALAFLQGTLTLGGGVIICGLFSLKMQWHGVIGAGVLALLGAARGLGNVPDFVKLLGGDHPRGPAPAMELGVTLDLSGPAFSGVA